MASTKLLWPTREEVPQRFLSMLSVRRKSNLAQQWRASWWRLQSLESMCPSSMPRTMQDSPANTRYTHLIFDWLYIYVGSIHTESFYSIFRFCHQERVVSPYKWPRATKIGIDSATLSHVSQHSHSCSSSALTTYYSWRPFLLCTDDDHRISLNPITTHANCSHSYINASYVDVSLYYYAKNMFYNGYSNIPRHTYPVCDPESDSLWGLGVQNKNSL